MLRFWMGRLIPAAESKYTWLSSSILPSSRITRPAIERSMVVLPEPEGPNSTAIPCCTTKLASSMKLTRPPVLNCFLRRTRSIGSGALRGPRQEVGQVNGRDRGEGENQSKHVGLTVLRRDERFKNR